MTIDQRALYIDMSLSNIIEAKLLKEKILEIVLKDEERDTNLQSLYIDLQCGDIPLYIALHELVVSGQLKGLSPYDFRAGNHDELYYWI